MNNKDIVAKRGNVTSQYGEDGVIHFLAEVLGSDVRKVCCEVGAGDGKTFSNVYSLWKKKGWDALLIEGAGGRFAGLLSECAGFANAHPVNEKIAATGKQSIESIAKRHGLSLDDGLLVVDIDSFDYHVINNIGGMRPAICVVEFNNSIPPWIDYWDPEGTVFLRHSLKALCRAAKRHHYQLVASTITNGIFVREDLAAKHGIQPCEPEDAYLYSEQSANRSMWGATVASQLVTSFPVFLNKPNALDRAYFRFRGWLRAKTGKEPYLRPSAAVLTRLAEAGLHI